MSRWWLLVGLAVAGCRAPSPPKTAESPPPPEVVERWVTCLAIDADRIFIGGQSGVILASRDSDPDPGIWLRWSAWSPIRKVVAGRDGWWAAGELDGSGEIKTYLLNYNCSPDAVIPGEDQSDFQFTADGKYLAVVSYNMLDVVERDSGKIIVHKEVGEPFEHSIELVDGGNARIARLSKWVDGEAKPIGWWDPVGNKPIADPGQIKPPWDYEVTRPEDRSHYDVARVSDGKKIGSITVPGEVHASQDWIMLGRHGMATYCGSGFAIYDLRTLTLAAWITVDAPRSSGYLVLTANGLWHGSALPTPIGLTADRHQPDAVWEYLKNACGL